MRFSSCADVCAPEFRNLFLEGRVPLPDEWDGVFSDDEEEGWREFCSGDAFFSDWDLHLISAGESPCDFRYDSSWEEGYEPLAFDGTETFAQSKGFVYNNFFYALRHSALLRSGYFGRDEGDGLFWVEFSRNPGSYDYPDLDLWDLSDDGWYDEGDLREEDLDDDCWDPLDDYVLEDEGESRHLAWDIRDEQDEWDALQAELEDEYFIERGASGWDGEEMMLKLRSARLGNGAGRFLSDWF